MSEEKNREQENRYDDLYRRSLGGIKTEPSARVWKRMNRKLLWKELLRFNFSNLPGYMWWLMTLMAVFIGAGTIWLAREEPETAIMPPATLSTGNLTPSTSVPQPSVATAEPSTPVASAEPSASAAPATVRVTPVAPVSAPAPVKEVAKPSLAKAETAPVPSPSTKGQELTLTREWLSSMRLLPAGISTLSSQPLSGILLLPSERKTPAAAMHEPAASVRKPLPKAFRAGINITPDIVFYQNNSSYFKYNYTFDAGAQLDLGRFYVRSGVGITFSSDVGDYAVSANKKDSVGYFYSVVSFTEDPSDPGRAQFTTMVTTVYDTNQYVYDYSTQNSYTYLNIPLVVGYRAIDRPRWSLSVDGGGFWSRLINLDEPEPVFYIPEGRIISVENNTPGHRNNSFGLMGSVRFEYVFAKRLSLVIAPTFKYHLNALDNKNISGATQPWSMGLNAGIWYRLNLTK